MVILQFLKFHSEISLLDDIYYSNGTYEHIGEVKRIIENLIFVEKDNLIDIKEDVYYELDGASYEFTRESQKLIDSLSLTPPITTNISLDTSNLVKLYINEDVIFEGKIKTHNTTDAYNEAYSRLQDLKDLFIRDSYTSQSIESIMKQMIEDYTDMTVTYDEDTIVLDKFYAIGNIYDLIVLLASIQGYYFEVGDSSIAIVTPTKNIVGTLYNNQISIRSAEKETEGIINNVIFEGKSESLTTTETYILDGSTNIIELNNIIASNTNVLKNGSEVTNFTIDNIGRRLIFTSNQTGTFDVTYTYDRPLLLEVTDDTSVLRYGIKTENRVNSLIEDEDIAINLTNSYLDETANEITSITAKNIDDYYRVNSYYKIVSSKFNVNKNLKCTKYILNNQDVKTVFSRGEVDIFNKYKDFQSSIDELETKYYLYPLNKKIRKLSDIYTITNNIELDTEVSTTKTDNYNVNLKQDLNVLITTTKLFNYKKLGIMKFGINKFGGI